MQKIDIRHKSGDSYSQKILFSSGGTPVDLTGSELLFKLKKDLDGATTLSKVLTISNAVGGEAKLDLTNIDTNLVGSYYYDIQLTQSNGFVQTIFGGSFIFEYNI